MSKEKSHPVDVLVIGCGMYVIGRGTNGYGTIIPTLFQAKKNGIVNKITIAGTKKDNKKIVDRKIKDLNKKMGTNYTVDYYPKNQNDQKAYEKLVKNIENTCAIVSIPDHLHFDVAKKLIKNKIHTLVVKPLSPTVKEVKNLIELQQKNNVYCAVEFHKRYDEVNLKAREILKNKKIGYPLYFLVEFSQRNTIPTGFFKEWVKHTNIFQYLGVHYADMIHFQTNAHPIRVAAIGQKNYLTKKKIDTYDSIQAFVEWMDIDTKNTFTSIILTNWIDPEKTTAMSDQKMKIICTEGRIESDQKDRGFKVIDEKSGIEDINPYFSKFYQDIDDKNMFFKGYGFNSINQFIIDVYNINNKNKKPDELKGLRATFEQALVSTSIIEAVNKSLQHDGKWIKIDRKYNIK